MSATATLPAMMLILDEPEPPRRRGWVVGRWIDAWFGVATLVVGLAFLVPIPLGQFLTFGYLLESSARVARTGRLRAGLIGVATAARIGRAAIGVGLALLPLMLVNSYAHSAAVIDPGGQVARGWRGAAWVMTALTGLHLYAALARGGRLRSLLWPLGSVLWYFGRGREGGVLTGPRDRLWEFAVGLHLPRYFRVGLMGFLGTLALLLPPAILLAVGVRVPLLGILGALWLGVVVPMLPFVQVRYALEGRFKVFLTPHAVRDRFFRAPWAFALALMVLLMAAIPLYLLKIEMVPRDAGWLPALVFVLFLWPARLLVGWAYARSERRERPRSWISRTIGRLAILPVAALYVLVVVLAPATSWDGQRSLFEQHAFALPMPALGP